MLLNSIFSEEINDEAYPKVYYQEGEENEDKDHIMNKSIPNFIMGNNSHNNYSNTSNVSPSPTTISPIEIVVDAKTLVAQTQDRMLKALEGNYLYDSSLKDSQDFL